MCWFKRGRRTLTSNFTTPTATPRALISGSPCEGMTTMREREPCNFTFLSSRVLRTNIGKLSIDRATTSALAHIHTSTSAETSITSSDLLKAATQSSLGRRRTISLLLISNNQRPTRTFRHSTGLPAPHGDDRELPYASDQCSLVSIITRTFDPSS